MDWASRMDKQEIVVGLDGSGSACRSLAMGGWLGGDARARTCERCMLAVGLGVTDPAEPGYLSVAEIEDMY